MSEGARGPYLTPNRALELERAIAGTEARLGERMDALERELGKVKRGHLDALRAHARALLEVLQEQTETTTRRASE